MITSKEYICTKCRRTLNIPSSIIGLNYCPMCDGVMRVLGDKE